MGHPGLWEVLLFGHLGLVWEVLLFGHQELVWVLDFLSVVMWLSRSVGQEPLAVGTPRSGVPLVHECV